MPLKLKPLGATRTASSSPARNIPPDLATLPAEEAAKIGSALAALPLETRVSAWRALFTDPSVARSPVRGEEAKAYNTLLGRSCIPWSTSSLPPRRVGGKVVGPYVVKDLVVVGEPTSGSTRGHGLVEAIVDGHRCMLKTRIGKRLDRYANPEAELLMNACVTRVGLPAAQVRLVDVSGVADVPRGLAPVCLAVEFIDESFARRHGGVGIEYNTSHGLAPAAAARLFAVDAVLAFCDRRFDNVFALRAGDDLIPVPFDHEQAARTALTDKRAGRHTAFLPTYGTPRDLAYDLKPADIGGIASLVHLTIHEWFLHFEKGRAAVLAAIPEVVRALDDTFLQQTVAAIPRWAIPEGVVAGDWERPGYEGHPAFVKPFNTALWGPFLDEHYGRLKERPLSGDALFTARKRELVTVAAWRRDHLEDAVRAYFDVVPARYPGLGP